MAPGSQTNTLIVTRLPASVFADATFMYALRTLFARYGRVYAFAPIKSFRRCIVTFWSPHDAERCKRDVDRLTLPASPASPNPVQIRVFRGANTPLRRPSSRSRSASPESPNPFYLAPPRLERNFLISPPCSPPDGWEQGSEAPPSPVTLAPDLVAALEKLHVARPGTVSELGSRVEIVYDAPNGAGGGILVSVVDCDADSDSEEDSDMSESETTTAWTSHGFASGEHSTLAPASATAYLSPLHS